MFRFAPLVSFPYLQCILFEMALRDVSGLNMLDPDVSTSNSEAIFTD